jgi:hypothetical protein
MNMSNALIVRIAYVWVTPAFVSGAPVDHTWVTTYDNQVTPLPDVESVDALGECYWFCWGSFHAHGDPATPLRSGTVNVPFAECLVRPNADSRLDSAARGTIFTYGADGVCHQLANQVLWASKDSTGAPLTTAGSNGYKASVFFYRMYGREKEAWNDKKTSCSSTPAAPPSPGNQMTDDNDDDFDKDARRILPPARFAELKALRERYGAELQLEAKAKINLRPGEQAAAEINVAINIYLHEVAKLLSRSEFESLFGFPPEQSIELVDRKMVRADKEVDR